MLLNIIHSLKYQFILGKNTYYYFTHFDVDDKINSWANTKTMKSISSKMFLPKMN